MRVHPGRLIPRRIRRRSRRRSSDTSVAPRRRSPRRRSMITFTPRTPARARRRYSYRAASFWCTTMSMSTLGHDSDGRVSRSSSWCRPQMLCVGVGSSSGSLSPRYPDRPSRAHDAQTILMSSARPEPLTCVASGQPSIIPEIHASFGAKRGDSTIKSCIRRPSIPERARCRRKESSANSSGRRGMGSYRGTSTRTCWHRSVTGDRGVHWHFLTLSTNAT